jgi:hypothetical protein
MIFLRHNMMIIGRPPSLHPPTSEDHEVRLPYWCADNDVELVFTPTYGSWLNWIVRHEVARVQRHSLKEVG